MAALGARNGRLSTRNFSKTSRPLTALLSSTPLFCTHPAPLVPSVNETVARSTVIHSLRFHLRPNDAENGSPLQSHPGTISFRLAWLGAYKMPLLPPRLSPCPRCFSFPARLSKLTLTTLLPKFQVLTSFIHPDYSRWHLCSFSRPRKVSTNTGLIPSFARKLEPNWKISVVRDGYLQTSSQGP